MASNVQSSASMRLSHHVEMSPVSVRAILDNWTREVHSRDDIKNRKSASDKIMTFLHNEAQNDLDLSELNLTVLPPVFSCRAFLERLKSLDLSSNLLEGVHPQILSLMHLEELDLSDNYNIDTIPDGIGNLRLLKKLVTFQDAGQYQEVLGSDYLAELELPRSFSNLTVLEELTIAGYAMREIPIVIYACINLRKFTFTNTYLSQIPVELCRRLPNLIELDVSCNFITRVPTVISNLSQLRVLNLGSNDIDSIPDSIFTLSNACSINLEETKLTQERVEAIEHRVGVEGYTGPTFILPNFVENAMDSSTEGSVETDTSNYEVPDAKRKRPLTDKI